MVLGHGRFLEVVLGPDCQYTYENIIIMCSMFTQYYQVVQSRLADLASYSPFLGNTTNLWGICIRYGQP